MATKSSKDSKAEQGGAVRGYAGPAALLFLSGSAGLIYQVLWVKQLSLVVGVDVYAVTTAVGAFFGGLALGSALLGRWVDGVERPFRLYAMLEAAIAVAGVMSTLLLAQSAPLFAALERTAGVLAWVLPFLLVGLPAVLMGGTVPVLVRALAPVGGQIASLGGRLYAANTAGAIAGTLLAPFALIPAFGVRGAAFAAGVLNLVAAAGALMWEGVNAPADRRDKASRGIKPLPPREPVSPSGFRLPLFLYALAGGVALGYEVVWSQTVVQWTSTRSFAFAVVLAVYLAGLTAGSAWYARRADQARDAWGDFGLFIALAGLVALLEVLLLGGWLVPLQTRAATLAFHITHRECFAMAARFLVAAGCVVLLPTFLLGAAFPAVVRIAVGAGRSGRDTGAIIALNTAGGIAGTAITGFILVPALGLERSLAVLALAAAAIGVIAVTRGMAVRPLRRGAVIACGLVTMLVTVALPSDHLAQALAKMRRGRLVFHESSAAGTVAIIEQKSGPNTFRRLYIQGVSNSGDSMTSLRYMRLQALLPLLIHRGEPKSALVIGLGTGITTGSLLAYPGLERRVCAELLPAVVKGVGQFTGNQDVATDPRVEVRVRDGRRELLRNAETYDLITLEPPPPSAAGVVNLYSRDFYELAASRLNPDGLVAQWLPLPTQTDADTRSLVRSFLDVFPYATLWTTELHEMLLVGSLTPIELDAVRIARRFEQPDVTKALAEVGVASIAALLATWVADQVGLERYAGDALPTTDDRPRIEYGGWVLAEDFWVTLPHLLAQRADPPVIGGSASLLAEIEHERAVLDTFYQAGLFAYQKDQARWQQAMNTVLRADAGNPYYRWFVTGP